MGGLDDDSLCKLSIKRNIIRWEHFEPQENIVDSIDDPIEDELIFNSQPVYMPTKMGLVPTSFYELDFNNISFWIGYTNFTVTELVAQTIEQTDGIESLEVYGKYRFRIGIAPLFNDNDTLKSIQNRLNCNPPKHNVSSIPIEIQPRVNKMTKTLWTKYIFWFIRIDKQNKINNYGTNNKLDFLEKLNSEKCKGGRIIMFNGEILENVT